MDPAKNPVSRDDPRTLEDMSDPLTISIGECARRLSISETSCYTLVKQGRIRGVAIGARNGKTLIPADEPEAFLAREAKLKGAADG